MFSINCGGRLLSLEQPVVMGIINVNEESFYVHSRRKKQADILLLAQKMLREGATILDIGGQSTAPKSTLVSAEEELRRVLPAIEAILSEYPDTLLSVDTFYAQVAKEAVKAGAVIINDISAGAFDPKMIETVAELGTPYVLMHMKGTPQNMHHMAIYEHLLTEVIDFFIEKMHICMQAGIKDIIIDPGYGFAKTIEQNFELLFHADTLRLLQRPVLAGLSRKATIYKTLQTTPEEALNGSTVLHTIALQKGAKILRVHDVKEAREAIQLFDAVNKYS